MALEGRHLSLRFASKGQPFLGHEPLRKLRNYAQSVKRSRLAIVQNLKNSSTSDIHWSTFAAMFFPFGRHVRTNMRFACKHFFFFPRSFFLQSLVCFTCALHGRLQAYRFHSLTHSSISDQLQLGRSFFEVGRTPCRSHKRKFLH